MCISATGRCNAAALLLQCIGARQTITTTLAAAPSLAYGYIYLHSCFSHIGLVNTYVCHVGTVGDTDCDWSDCLRMRVCFINVCVYANKRLETVLLSVGCWSCLSRLLWQQSIELQLTVFYNVKTFFFFLLSNYIFLSATSPLLVRLCLKRFLNAMQAHMYATFIYVWMCMCMCLLYTVIQKKFLLMYICMYHLAHSIVVCSCHLMAWMCHFVAAVSNCASLLPQRFTSNMPKQYQLS